LTTEYFIFDGDNVLASYTSNGTLNASYLTPLLRQRYSAKQLAAKHEGYGGQAGLDANLSMTNATDTYYSFTDALGSIRNVVESDEDVANVYDYRAFGILITETENVDSPFEFTGRAREPGGLSHMHYYHNRYYMPGVGIFTSRDAMWADVHRGWGYVGNVPTMYVDPYGLLTQEGHEIFQDYMDNLTEQIENGCITPFGAFANALRKLFDLEKKYGKWYHFTPYLEFLQDAMYYFTNPDNTYGEKGIVPFMDDDVPWENDWTPPGWAIWSEENPQGAEQGYVQLPGDGDNTNRHDHFLANAWLGYEIGGFAGPIRDYVQKHVKESSSTDRYVNQKGTHFGQELSVRRFKTGDQVEEWIIDYLRQP